jgi:transposase
MVVLIDVSMMSNSHPRCATPAPSSSSLGWVEPCEKYCTHCGCDMDRDINAAMDILKVFLFHVREWESPDYLCRLNQHQVQVVHTPETAEV